MNVKKYIVALFAGLLLISSNALAIENVGTSGKTGFNFKAAATDCSAASAQIDLDINNVRTTLLNGGDLWWNLNDARYEIPKIDPPGSAPSVHSLFAGAIWLGGIDAGGQLKVAAQTYRQSGNDFWPGPLDAQASIDQAECERYDRFWRVTGQEIEDHIANLQANGGTVAVSAVPSSILEWPARGNAFAKDATNAALPISAATDLAPFFDANGDGIYNPEQGDYPVIDGEDDMGVYADQMIFWVYNDKGNVHTETNGQPIGVQVNALAFAFATSDEINDMTFYSYKLINKATTVINSFYMSQWVDSDLGCFNNDYVGCDTARSLGICYNGTPTDPDCASRGYGDNPPLIGVDYFEGPLADLKDGLDNDRDGLVDEGADSTDNDLDGLVDELDEREKLGMSTFTYYDNNFEVTGNPETAVHYYGYMSGFWKDNSPFEFGGNGYQQGTFPFPYNFPGDPSDPSQWSECFAVDGATPNTPADRRFLQTSGPFTLQPGAVNNITVGVVWVRPPDGFQCGQSSYDATIGVASDKAQALFDNNFKLVDGPDAPTIEIRELDQEIILSLVNVGNSNNIGESYDQVDPIAQTEVDADPAGTTGDVSYTFEGYKVYQLVNAQVSASELNDLNSARLVSQVDIENGVSRIINFTFDASLGANIPSLEVDGRNTGIRHSFQVTEDRFSTGESNGLVNHETYFFAAIAYAYNSYKEFDALNPTDGGQRTPYLQGRRNFRVYSAIPHMIDADRGGTVINAQYGDGLVVTRLDGEGNGGLDLELTEESEQLILTNSFQDEISYEPRMGPVDVQVYDPVKLKNAEFTLKLQDVTGIDPIDSSIVNETATWSLNVLNLDNGSSETITSERAIGNFNEQLINDYGISLSFGQVDLPGRGAYPLGQVDYEDNSDSMFVEANGLISASLTFDDPEQAWLAGVSDAGTFNVFNWQRSGSFVGSDGDGNEGYFDDHFHIFTGDGCRNIDDGCDKFWDPNGEYSNVLGASWTPYALATNKQFTGDLDARPDLNGQPKYTFGPAFPWRFKRSLNQLTQFRIPLNNMDQLYGVDIVLTSDKTKWTRCVVIETGEDPSLNIGGSYKGQIRNQNSKDIDGNVIASDTGRSWFPGYAINVETGERLNLIFGENSFLTGERGDDMIWNPTNNVQSPLRQTLFGGGHYIYVHNSRYDEGELMQEKMLEYFNEAGFNGNVPPADPIWTADTLNRYVYRGIMWTSMALLDPQFNFDNPSAIPTDARVRLRVNRPYRRFVATGSNAGLPEYGFSTEGLAPDTAVLDVAKSACDMMNVVPNPYYAYSAYETSQLDNRVKITNLPSNCTVSIFTLSGTLVRKFERGVSGTTSEGTTTEVVNLDNTIDWDLKNSKNIPVASGMYLIHIQADGVCERTIKWYGSLRPIDLDTF